MSERKPTMELRQKAVEQLVRDINRAGEAILGEAQRRAPLDEGTLRGSAQLAMIVNGSRYEGSGALAAAIGAARAAVAGGRSVTVTAELSFNTVYAARQHEELDWNHPKGGEAKYLEKPMHENAPRIGTLIAAGQRRIMG